MDRQGRRTNLSRLPRIEISLPHHPESPMTTLRSRLLVAAALVPLFVPSAAFAQGGSAFCILPDGGGGSASLPPNFPLGSTGSRRIIEGLPVGSLVLIAARLHSFTTIVESPGGTLGGEQSSWNATLNLNLTGTGVSLGYNRFAVPVSGVSNSAPGVPCAPVQSFAIRKAARARAAPPPPAPVRRRPRSRAGRGSRPRSARRAPATGVPPRTAR